MSKSEEALMEAEMKVRGALEEMKNACDKVGMDFRERLEDLIYDAENNQ